MERGAVPGTADEDRVHLVCGHIAAGLPLLRRLRTVGRLLVRWHRSGATATATGLGGIRPDLRGVLYQRVSTAPPHLRLLNVRHVVLVPTGPGVTPPTMTKPRPPPPCCRRRDEVAP